MKYLAPIPKQFVDQNGLPLSNGTVHVYISGDTQYANVYQDADGEELMPNPARLDSNGAWLGFVTAGVPLDYVVEDKDGNVQFEYEKVVAGGGSDGGGGEPVYIQESHTSSDSNVTIASQKTTCTFDSNLENFAGELHVRFQNSGQAATVALYVNDEYNDKIVSTLPVMSGMTHLMVPVSVKSGSLRAEVTFATASTPSSVKFDLVGYNLVASGGGSGGSGDQFVLVRSNMTTNFTNEEYQACTNAVTSGQAVCVQFVRNSRTFQAQLTQVEHETGLLVFEIDVANIHITYEVSGTNNSHVITESDYQSGTPIFDTLQDAVTYNVVLHNGDIFETNGFHTSGDGGAARYKVSSTGTANGMDIVQLAAGKLAVLQVGDWIIPEQLGYQQSYSRDDVVPYITHAISLGCQHIHLRSSGTGAGYTWKTKLTVNVKGFKLTGEGDWGYPNKFTYIVFRPTDATVDAMIDMKARDVVLKDLDIEVTGDYVKVADGITNTGYNSDENRFWEIDNVRFNSFNNCIKFSGGIKWQNSIKNCLFNSCNIGLQIYESSTFELIVENCLFTNCEQYDVLVNGGLFAAVFTSCGFGSQNSAIGMTVNSDNYMYQNIKFEGCNFELDSNELANAPAVFIDCFPNSSHPYVRQNVTISNCHFTIAKLTQTVQDTTNRYIRLAPKTNLLLIANQILGKDEPHNPDWVVYPKLLWNENYLPTLSFGGIIECGNNLCGNGTFEYPDELLPFVTRSTQARSLLAVGAQSGVESAISDCNTFIPEHCGEMSVARVSTYESTSNMPTTSIFGFLYSVGVTEGPNKRVIQMMIASNANIYTRIGRDTGGGWQFDAWKTIAAS